MIPKKSKKIAFCHCAEINTSSLITLFRLTKSRKTLILAQNEDDPQSELLRVVILKFIYNNVKVIPPKCSWH